MGSPRGRPLGPRHLPCCLKLLMDRLGDTGLAPPSLTWGHGPLCLLPGDTAALSPGPCCHTCGFCPTPTPGGGGTPAVITVPQGLLGLQALSRAVISDGSLGPEGGLIRAAQPLRVGCPVSVSPFLFLQTREPPGAPHCHADRWPWAWPAALPRLLILHLVLCPGRGGGEPDPNPGSAA